ncbi:MAG: hypothetical protein LBI43_05070 [Streptococcaceae bacterium]|jgi:hypothetical protein|nr:hypothetical protein [Streptococcaceae bacterium]
MNPNTARAFLGSIPMIPLVTLFVITLVVAYGIAWYYREEYNPMHYLRAYALYALPYALAALVLHMRPMLILGIYLFGGIILVFRNQHYFDH